MRTKTDLLITVRATTPEIAALAAATLVKAGWQVYNSASHVAGTAYIDLKRSATETDAAFEGTDAIFGALKG